MLQLVPEETPTGQRTPAIYLPLILDGQNTAQVPSTATPIVIVTVQATVATPSNPTATATHAPTMPVDQMTSEPTPIDTATATPTPSATLLVVTATATPIPSMTPGGQATSELIITLTATATPRNWIRAATVETVPVPNSGDAADDPAIWLHPQDRNLSTIIGTDKKGGIAIYNLDGSQLQYLPDGNLNNVDLRDDFPLGGQFVTLVTAGNRSTNSIAIYRVNVATRQLENVAARVIPLGLAEAYGSCMYHSQTTGKYYLIINDPTGQVEQWQLFDNGSGQVDGTLVRSFVVGSQTEGCATDDELGHLYIGEELVGIWKYGAEPNAGVNRTLVDGVGTDGHLTADVEGLSLYLGANGAGYLLASSQGSDQFVVYQRSGNNPYVATFDIVAGNGIDAVTGTDGIDVTSAALGTQFPEGLFVTQDGTNDQGNQNYKLVPWPAIATTLNPPLNITPVN